MPVVVETERLLLGGSPRPTPRPCCDGKRPRRIAPHRRKPLGDDEAYRRHIRPPSSRPQPARGCRYSAIIEKMSREFVGVAVSGGDGLSFAAGGGVRPR